MNAGELSPLLDGRNDQEKYNMGCRIMENAFPLIYGGAERRPGTEFIASQKVQSAIARLVGFEYSVDDTYMLCFEDQVIRLFKNGLPVVTGSGTEDISTLNNIVAHWKLNENNPNATVVNSNANAYHGTATISTNYIHETGKVGSGCFNLGGEYAISVADNSAFTFSDNSNDSPFSIACWAFVSRNGLQQTLVSKWKEDTVREWRLFLDAQRKLQLYLCDDSISISTDTTAQWKLNENAADKVILDTTANNHDGLTQVANTSALTAAGKISTCLNMGGTDAVVVTNDSDDFSFEETTHSKPFSITAWIFNPSLDSLGNILTKWDDATDREWNFSLEYGILQLVLADETNNVDCRARTNNPLSPGWHFVCATYDSTGGATAANGIKLYVDGVIASSTATNNASYSVMRNGATKVVIGGVYVDGSLAYQWPDKIDNVCLFKKELAAIEVFNLYNNGLGTEALLPTMPNVISNDSLSLGWHFITATYSAPSDSATAANGMILYVDGVPINVTRSNDTLYTAMKNTAVTVKIGCQEAAAGTNEKFWADKIDNVAIFSDVLTPAEVSSLYATSIYEIKSPYLTSDLQTLDIKQSADVMFITHDDYEPRKLSRLDDTVWTLEVTGISDGPFREENTIVAKTITPSATTGTITLTATGHTPFAIGSVYGHSPSGSSVTSKSQTGTLFKLVHPLTTSNIGGVLAVETLNAATATLQVARDTAWDWTTQGTWGSAVNAATVVLERSYDSGSTYETVATATSAGNYNIVINGVEEVADALYRSRVSEAGADTDCQIMLSVRDTSYIGIVKIVSVESPTSATAVVLKTLGSTAATHRWSEGAWSNYRGWPRTVEISPEERLTLSGSISQPITSWGSVSNDYTSFLAGDLDDSAITFTLVGSGQQNIIQWVVSKDSLMFGTVGGEQLLGGSGNNEALTPSNVQARIKGTTGSEHTPALRVNTDILFVQRGGRKIRELSNSTTYDADIYNADDLTVFSNHITESGIVSWAYQRTPDPMIWCFRNDGQIAVMVYEKKQNLFSWSRVKLAGTSTKVESIAVIYGGAGNEDEVWLTVSRIIDGSTIRNIERFRPRELDTVVADWFFVDSGVIYNGVATSTVSGLGHLEDETVQVWADGVRFDDAVVAGGSITLKLNTVTKTASKVQVGLGYTTTIQPMKMDLSGLSLAGVKKITEGTLQLYNTVGGEWGNSTTAMYPFKYDSASVFTATTLFTGHTTIPFSGGYDKSGDIIIRQTGPYPMTVLALSLDVGIHI